VNRDSDSEARTEHGCPLAPVSGSESRTGSVSHAAAAPLSGSESAAAPPQPELSSFNGSAARIQPSHESPPRARDSDTDTPPDSELTSSFLLHQPASSSTDFKLKRAAEGPGPGVPGGRDGPTPGPPASRRMIRIGTRSELSLSLLAPQGPAVRAALCSLSCQQNYLQVNLKTLRLSAGGSS
jgi:hypothetical protein